MAIAIKAEDILEKFWKERVPQNIVRERREILFLYDVKRCNPNGDVLENDVRVDTTGRCIVSDVRLKRTIRDYLEEEGETIFTGNLETLAGYYKKNQDRVNELIEEIKKEAGEERFTEIERMIVEEKGVRKRGERGKGKGGGGNGSSRWSELITAYPKILQKCIDIRLFGAILFRGSGSTSIQVTGPVQFAWGESLHRVEVRKEQGTGGFASENEKANRTFRVDSFVEYALIGFYGVVSERNARKVFLTEDDLGKMREAMWYGMQIMMNTRSKRFHRPLFYLEVIYREGVESHIGFLDEFLKIESDREEEEIRSINDYEVNGLLLADVLKKNAEKIKKVLYKKDWRLRIKGLDFIEEGGVNEAAESGFGVEELSFI